MGEITVFVSDKCADSQLVRTSFSKYAIPFQEINVDYYPRQRACMYKLTDRLTTPQIFFNMKHIGGVTEVIILLKQYDEESQRTSSTVFDRISSEVLKTPMLRKNKEIFQITGAKNVAAEISHSKDRFDSIRMYDVVRVFDGEESNIGQLTRDLLKVLSPKKNRSKNFIKSLPAHSDKFSGKKAIEIFIKDFNLPSSDSAIDFGQKILSLGIIHQVDTDYTVYNGFTARGYFRLQPLSTPKILNSFRIWTKKTGLDQLMPDHYPSLTLSRLIRQLTEIITFATNDLGGVDYEAAKKNSSFSNFEEAVCQLQLINLDLMDGQSKKAFFINVYNLMTKHAIVKFYPKKLKSYILDMYYNIGGFLFSLEDIYHGILRNNSNHPKRHTKMFDETDRRTSFAFKDIDPRIHFALNNMDHTTFYEYHEDAIDEELRIVAELYCKSNERIYINGSKNMVIFPKFMKMYLSDFTTNSDKYSLPEEIMKFLRMDRNRMAELSSILERTSKDKRITVLFKDKSVSTRRTLFSTTMLHFRLQKFSPKIFFDKHLRRPMNSAEITRPINHIYADDRSTFFTQVSNLTNITGMTNLNRKPENFGNERRFKRPNNDRPGQLSKFPPFTLKVNTQSTLSELRMPSNLGSISSLQSEEFTLSDIYDDYSVDTKTTNVAFRSPGIYSPDDKSDCINSKVNPIPDDFSLDSRSTIDLLPKSSLEFDSTFDSIYGNTSMKFNNKIMELGSPSTSDTCSISDSSPQTYEYSKREIDAMKIFC